MNRIIPFLIVALLALPSISRADSFGGGGFYLGLNILDMSELNNALGSAGYSDFKDNNLFFGGGGYGLVFDHLILGGSGGAIYYQEVATAGVLATLRGGYGVFNFGYSMFRSSRYHLFPYGGMGGGGLQLDLIPDAGEIDFGDVIKEPKKISVLTRMGICLDAGFEVDFLIPMGEDKTGFGGFMIGVRAGYLYFPTNTSWKLADYKVPGGPDTWLTGPYVHFVIGGFGGSGPSEGRVEF